MFKDTINFILERTISIVILSSTEKETKIKVINKIDNSENIFLIEGFFDEFSFHSKTTIQEKINMLLSINSELKFA